VFESPSIDRSSEVEANASVGAVITSKGVASIANGLHLGIRPVLWLSTRRVLPFAFTPS
jgi:hypothetical protein